MGTCLPFFSELYSPHTSCPTPVLACRESHLRQPCFPGWEADTQESATRGRTRSGEESWIQGGKDLSPDWTGSVQPHLTLWPWEGHLSPNNHTRSNCKKRWKKVRAAQSCLTLCNLMDCSLPGSSVHWIFQARILEWGAIVFSKCTCCYHANRGRQRDFLYLFLLNCLQLKIIFVQKWNIWSGIFHPPT